MGVDGYLEQHRVGLEARGHALHLSVLHLSESHTAIDIVVAELRRDDDILHPDALAVSAGTTRRDDDVGMVPDNHLHRTDGGVHLPYSTLLHHHLVFREDIPELAQFFLHCYDNSYLHGCKGTTLFSLFKENAPFFLFISF